MPFPYEFPIVWGVMPAFRVLVSDTLIDAKWQSIGVELRIEERGVAGFTISDVLGTGNYARGEPVEIYDLDDTLIFGGFIDIPEASKMAPAGGLYHSITCKDNHYLVDKRLVVKSYINTLAGDIFKDIITDYLAAEGVTEGTIEDGPLLAEAILNYVRASDGFNAIKELSGSYTWFIDENKALHFIERSSNAAPWALDGIVNRPLKGSTKLNTANSFYRKIHR